MHVGHERSRQALLRSAAGRRIEAVLAGEKIHFIGATGPLNFSDNGRVNALAYDIWQHHARRHGQVMKTIKFQP